MDHMMLTTTFFFLSFFSRRGRVLCWLVGRDGDLEEHIRVRASVQGFIVLDGWGQCELALGFWPQSSHFPRVPIPGRASRLRRAIIMANYRNSPCSESFFFLLLELLGMWMVVLSRLCPEKSRNPRG